MTTAIATPTTRWYIPEATTKRALCQKCFNVRKAYHIRMFNCRDLYWVDGGISMRMIRGKGYETPSAYCKTCADEYCAEWNY